MWEVGRATSAAPTYFEPAKLPSHGLNERGYWALVDAGVFANTPALCGLTEAITNYRREALGAPAVGAPAPRRDLRRRLEDGGLPGRRAVQSDGSSAAAVLPHAVSLTDFGSDDLDDASRTNIAALERHARELIERESDNLDAIAQELGP
jgi:uncharacterized protein